MQYKTAYQLRGCDCLPLDLNVSLVILHHGLVPACVCVCGCMLLILRFSSALNVQHNLKHECNFGVRKYSVLVSWIRLPILDSEGSDAEWETKYEKSNKNAYDLSSSSSSRTRRRLSPRSLEICGFMNIKISTAVNDHSLKARYT